jgi:hypothetical protein
MACHEGYPGHHTRNTLKAPHRAEADDPEDRGDTDCSPGP